MTIARFAPTDIVSPGAVMDRLFEESVDEQDHQVGTNPNPHRVVVRNDAPGHAVLTSDPEVIPIRTAKETED